jgi:hypothetical protein
MHNGQKERPELQKELQVMCVRLEQTAQHAEHCHLLKQLLSPLPCFSMAWPRGSSAIKVLYSPTF